MEQGVHAVQVVQLAELLLQDALKIPTAKRANFVFFAWPGLDAPAKARSFFEGEALSPPLSGAMPQTLYARSVVAMHPFLNHAPRHIERLRNLLRGATLRSQHDALQSNSHPRVPLRSSHPPQLVQSVTILYVHPASFPKGKERTMHKFKPGAIARTYLLGLVLAQVRRLVRKIRPQNGARGDSRQKS
jgi:hypothetical protein